MKTQVAIIGAGPAGLLLGHILRQAGIDCLILERHTQAYVLSRIRAGVLERTMTDLLSRLGIDKGLKTHGMRHDGLTLVTNGDVIEIPVLHYTGKHVTVYGQTEITLDLINAAPERGLEIVWEAKDVALHNITSSTPSVTWQKVGISNTVTCDYIVGCDGFHGPARLAIPDVDKQTYQFDYPFGWLGVMVDVPPCHPEVVYANHERGFALASMRSPTRSRLYIQVGMDEKIEDWSDSRFFEEFATRIGPEIARHMAIGPSIEKSIAPLRSFVCEPMRYGQLFLAGDAAHIVPPTGAKGLNLAASDVIYLGDALIKWFKHRGASGIDGYSKRALARVWKTERFSWYLTRLMHCFPNASDFEKRMQDAELKYVATSEAAQIAIAENYVGLPL